MNIMIRSFDARKIIMPATANSPSTNTSVCSNLAVVASTSSTLPGAEDAEAANDECPPFTSRSANTNMLRNPNTSSIAHWK